MGVKGGNEVGGLLGSHGDTVDTENNINLSDILVVGLARRH